MKPWDFGQPQVIMAATLRRPFVYRRLAVLLVAVVLVSPVQLLPGWFTFTPKSVCEPPEFRFTLVLGSTMNERPDNVPAAMATGAAARAAPAITADTSPTRARVR